MNEIENIYFLGAGSSADAGIPIFRDFREKAKEVYENYKNILNAMSENDSKKDIINKKINRFKNVLEYWRQYYDNYNIEDYYNTIDMFEILSEFPYGAFDTNNIKTVIYDTIRESLKPNEKLNSCYNRFLYHVGHTNSKIITTNWDIVPECTKIDWNIPTLNTNSNFYGYYIIPYPKKICDIDDKKAFDIKILWEKILKLHGSLNWCFCGNCGKVYYINDIYDDIVRPILCSDSKCKNIKLNPFIIPPTLSKLIKKEYIYRDEGRRGTTVNEYEYPYVHTLRSIWSEAMNNLMSCKRIYFVGYSLPDTDVQTKLLIENSLRLNQSLKEIIVVTKNKRFQDMCKFKLKYRKFFYFKDIDIKFYNYGFEGFCENLLDMKQA